MLMCRCYVCVCAGDMYEIGAEKGKYYSVNVPLRDGIDDQSESSIQNQYTTLTSPPQAMLACSYPQYKL